jgi:hypothetical protein
MDAIYYKLGATGKQKVIPGLQLLKHKAVRI